MSIPEVKALAQDNNFKYGNNNGRPHRRLMEEVSVTPSNASNSIVLQRNTSVFESKKTLSPPPPPPPPKPTAPPSRFSFDILITDTESLKSLRSMGLEKEANCKYRVLDVWGTPPSQNHLKLHTKQFWVPFPFSKPNEAVDLSPNTVVGNRVEGIAASMLFPEILCSNTDKGNKNGGGNIKKLDPVPKLRQIAIWGKEPKYFTPNVIQVLGQISKELNIPMYVAGKKAVTCRLPNGVYNLGILSIEDRNKLLSESLFFIGLGDPVLGASPFEAMAHGTIYLNPVYPQPKNLWQNRQFHYTSQHQYAGFVGAPLSYDISWQTNENGNFIVDVIKSVLIKLEGGASDNVNGANNQNSDSTVIPTTSGNPIKAYSKQLQSVPFIPISLRPEYIESIVLENIYRDYCSMPKSLRSRGVAPDPPSAHPSKFNKIPWETLKNGCAKTLDKKQVSPVDLTNVTSCRGSKFIVLKDKDIQGYDLSTVSSNIFENCCFHCSNSSNCFSFTFVDGTCRLKKLNVLKIDQNNQNKVFTTKVGVLSALTAELS